MQTSAEIRRSRLGQLVEKYGSIADLNQAIGWARTDPKLSQIKNNNKRPGRDASYQMGDAMAREIEEALGLERGWMDNPITASELSGHGNARIKITQLMEGLPDDQLAVALRLLDALAKPAPGNGTTG
jgi:hypothetical protein